MIEAAPVTFPGSVMPPAPPIDTAPLTATSVLQLAAAPALELTSETDRVEPSSERLSAEIDWPLRSSVPPAKSASVDDVTIVPAAVEPSAWALPSLSVPATTTVSPLYVFTPLRTVVPTGVVLLPPTMSPNVREGVTDIGGLVLAGYLATRQLVPGTWALGFVLVLLLPSPVLVKIAKIVAARQGHSGAVAALLGASAAWANFKTGAVAIGAGAVALGACL